MRKLEIFEPPLCCPTGVCGPAPDPALATLQENVLRWKKEGIAVERIAINQDLYPEYTPVFEAKRASEDLREPGKVREMYALFTEECGEPMANMISMRGMMMGRKGGGCCG